MLILVSTSEQSCSALKRSKTYLPGSMKGKQLNNLIMPHFHKDKMGTMDMLEVTNDFVEWRDNRSQIYDCYGTSNCTEKASVKI